MATETAGQQQTPLAKPAAKGGIVEYFNGVREELKPPKTHWPDRAEMIRLTQVVLILITVVAAYCGGMDYLLTQLARLLTHK
jgi:preprotein translocase SecE subunit